MWHEARKQERKIRGLMVDYKKRAERRREFYEKIKLDPAQFVHIYGRPYKIHLDPATAMAAEGPQSMMPWQGNSDNMIDRFDVRAHLDFIPEFDGKLTNPFKTSAEDEEERQCNYERYRSIVENEAAGLTEEQCLHQIYLDEQFGSISQNNEEEKKRSENKAAIAFTYDDSGGGGGGVGKKNVKPVGDSDNDSDSSDTDIEAADLDVTLNVDMLTSEQIVVINKCAEQYGMKNDDFVRLLKKDKAEIEALRMAKLVEEEKAQFSGRKSRRERRAFKDKRLMGRKVSPPSYAARDSPKYEPYKKSSSSSRSRSRSPVGSGKVLFITSFGEEEDHPVQGPSLPDTLLKSDNKSWSSSKRSSTSSRSRSRSRSSNRKKSYRKRENINKTPDRKTSRNRSSRSRSRSRSTSRRKRSRSSSSRSTSYSYTTDSCSSSRSRSRSRSGSQKPVIKSYRKEIKSSDSDISSSDDDKRKSYNSRYTPSQNKKSAGVSIGNKSSSYQVSKK